MPHLSLQISSIGPVVDILVGVSEGRTLALQQARQAVPSAVRIRGLIDTGASNTCIDVGVLQQLRLKPTGRVSMAMPSTGAVLHTSNQFDVSLVLIHPSLSLHLKTIPVIESELASGGIQALIGRDIPAKCLLVYDGQAGNFLSAF